MGYTVVTESCANIRALAREALSGKWKAATLTLFVWTIAMIAPAFVIIFFFEGESVSALGDLYTILVSGAFTLGITYYFLNMLRGNAYGVSQIFSGFEKFFKTLGLYFMISLFTFLWTLLLIIPGIVAAYRYSLAFYILADNPEYGVMQCIRESKKMTNGNKMKLFLLSLSFIGWAFAMTAVLIVTTIFTFISPEIGGVITIVVACILSLLFYAYVFMSVTVFYEMASGRLIQRDSFIDKPLSREDVAYTEEENSAE